MSTQRKSTPRAPRRWLRMRRVLLACVALLLLTALLAWLLQPARLARFASARLGDALGLSIRYDAARMTLRPLPRLQMHGVAIGQPQRPAFLSARALDVSMPWRTVRGGGKVLDFERVVLDSPMLDLPALQRWLATQPPSELVMPHFRRGLELVNGSVLLADARLTELGIEVPRWQAGAAADVAVRARWQPGRVAIATNDAPGATASAGNARDQPTLEWHQSLHLDAVAADTSLRLSGTGEWQQPGLRLTWRQRLDGRLHLHAERWQLAMVRIAADATLLRNDARVPMTIGLAAADIALAGKPRALTARPLALVVLGSDPLPARSTLIGGVSLDRGLHLSARGMLSDWPAGWPALPMPLAASRAPLSLALDYRAATTQPARLAFEAARDGTRLDGNLDPARIAAWWQAPAGNPLPPLTGRITTPRVQLGAATLEGVEVELHDDTPASTPP